MRLAVIGVPFNSSGLTTGEARAPSVLRTEGVIPALQQSADVADYGDLRFDPPTPHRDPMTGLIAPETLVQMVDGVRLAVRRALEEQRLPVVIGGECPLLLGCLAAARDVYGRVGLVFVDGHEDAWPPHVSTTGEAADMELGWILGLTAATGLPGLARLLPLVRPEDTLVLGSRDREEVRAAGVTSIVSEVALLDDAELRAADIDATVTALVARLHTNTGAFWLHLDLDVLSTEALAAVRYRQSGGLSWDELATLTTAAARVPGLIGWDITIYNPDLDPELRGAGKVIEFLADMAKRLT